MGPVEALTLLLYSHPLLEYVMECSIFMNKISYPILSIHVAHYPSAYRCRIRIIRMRVRSRVNRRHRKNEGLMFPAYTHDFGKCLRNCSLTLNSNLSDRLSYMTLRSRTCSTNEWNVLKSRWRACNRTGSTVLVPSHCV
jgi:hypothetical protein